MRKKEKKKKKKKKVDEGESKEGVLKINDIEKEGGGMKKK